ncbi:MAG: DUF1667 domain-containing protein [Planctomycetaceae bacterium]|nr:DUF1667 domain-containing protein [Planctomycetaceae bacterium]
MTKTLTCINCPLGCTLEVTTDQAGTIVSVSGNQCIRGVAYATMELTNPTRVLTTTVRIEGADIAMVPIKTAAAVPKGLVMAIAASLKDTVLRAPVARGMVVTHDACGTGVDVVVTRTVPAKAPAGENPPDDGMRHSGLVPRSTTKR